jgi:SAM-dependent methyltransferase
VRAAILEGKPKETMMVARQSGDEQTALWNGPAGRAWVDTQRLLDQIFKPFEDLLVEAVSAGGSLPGLVLDVGCGTGSTTLAVARLLGEKGRCIGIDISEPMITAARARAERESTPATFIRANAQIHTFETARFERELVQYLTRLGPVGRFLEDANEPTRTRVIETVRPAFDPYVHGAEVRFTAACWVVSARAPSTFSPAK